MDPDRNPRLSLREPTGKKFLSGLPDTLRSASNKIIGRSSRPAVSLPSIGAWRNTHQGQCPGVAVGNFFPKTDSSFVVALIQGEDPKNLLEKLVLLTEKKGQTITEIVVNPAQVTSPALVWKLPPGHYAGVDGKRAAISRDSFVFEKVASSATQFYYQGSKLQSFVISN